MLQFLGSGFVYDKEVVATLGESAFHGFGINTFSYGRAATGKSMTAESVAKALGKRVYLISYAKLDSERR